MLVRSEPISSKLAPWEELARQMAELIALRRAVCLLEASRDRPRGYRRRLSIASARSARSVVCYRSPQRRDFNVPQA